MLQFHDKVIHIYDIQTHKYDIKNMVGDFDFTNN